MKIKSSAVGLIIAATMVVAVGPLQAACYRNEPGWHMVSKYCNVRPADTWQEYTSGVYTAPVSDRGGFLFIR